MIFHRLESFLLKNVSQAWGAELAREENWGERWSFSGAADQAWFPWEPSDSSWAPVEPRREALTQAVHLRPHANWANRGQKGKSVSSYIQPFLCNWGCALSVVLVSAYTPEEWRAGSAGPLGCHLTAGNTLPSTLEAWALLCASHLWTSALPHSLRMHYTLPWAAPSLPSTSPGRPAEDHPQEGTWENFMDDDLVQVN